MYDNWSNMPNFVFIIRETFEDFCSVLFFLIDNRFCLSQPCVMTRKWKDGEYGTYNARVTNL